MQASTKWRRLRGARHTLWQKLTIAILGGDGRGTEMASLAADAGASVRLFGTPPSDRRDVTRVSSLAEALDGARIAILPVPYPGADGALYAPFAEAPIHITAEDLSAMAAKAHVITGKSDAFLDAAAEKARVMVHEYEDDTDLMLLRAPAIAEGAIRVAIEHSPVTVHGAADRVGRFRSDRIGPHSLTNRFERERARFRAPRRGTCRRLRVGRGTAPFRRGPPDLPAARDSLQHGPGCGGGCRCARTSSERKPRRRPRCSSGGIDLAAARDRGLSTIWARGLGASAPRTVARSQWIGVERIARSVLSGQSMNQAT